MCGIIGYIGSKQATPLIMEGLRKLEYRGYDSAGIAIFDSDHIDVIKQKGKLSALKRRLEGLHLEGQIGIGHTRWATHGEPSEVNSHPHLGGQERIAVVHNGIIENYRSLTERLEAKGISLASQTDSEVIAQLAEYYYDGNIVSTSIKVAHRLEGSYALGMLSLDDPDVLVALKKDNPLIIGVSEAGNFIASDVPAILRHTNKVYYLDDKEVALLTRNGVRFFNFDGEVIEKCLETITWSMDSAEKGGYPHFMLKEIMEQPRVLEDTLQSTLSDSANKQVLENLDLSGYTKVVITACGSAYNAGVVARYVIESLCRLTVEVELASEFRYKDPLVDGKTLVILISQSGETADTIAALREARAKGAFTLAIVNVVGSTIAKEANTCLFTAAGPEIAVATTKAFSTQLVLLYALALRFAEARGALAPEQLAACKAEIATLPGKVASLLEQVDTLQKYAASCVGYKSIFFIGRNIDYAIALEGSLKLKEISYIHSEAYAAGELKHGTISLIEEDTLVVALVTNERLFEKTMSNVEQVISRGAKVLLIGNCPGVQPNEKLTFVSLPACFELFSPSLSVIILQLFSYYVAADKGLDIDKPRNLAKSVTVE